MKFKGISYLKLNYPPKGIEKSSRDFLFKMWVKFFGELFFVPNEF